MVDRWLMLHVQRSEQLLVCDRPGGNLGGNLGMVDGLAMTCCGSHLTSPNHHQGINSHWPVLTTNQPIINHWSLTIHEVRTVKHICVDQQWLAIINHHFVGLYRTCISQFLVEVMKSPIIFINWMAQRGNFSPQGDCGQLSLLWGKDRSGASCGLGCRWNLGPWSHETRLKRSQHVPVLWQGNGSIGRDPVMPQPSQQPLMEGLCFYQLPLRINCGLFVSTVLLGVHQTVGLYICTLP